MLHSQEDLVKSFSPQRAGELHLNFVEAMKGTGISRYINGTKSTGL
jgi:hypothetical protein